MAIIVIQPSCVCHSKSQPFIGPCALRLVRRRRCLRHSLFPDRHSLITLKPYGPGRPGRAGMKDTTVRSFVRPLTCVLECPAIRTWVCSVRATCNCLLPLHDAEDVNDDDDDNGSSQRSHSGIKFEDKGSNFVSSTQLLLELLLVPEQRHLCRTSTHTATASRMFMWIDNDSFTWHRRGVKQVIKMVYGSCPVRVCVALPLLCLPLVYSHISGYSAPEFGLIRCACVRVF